MSTINIYF